MNTWTKQMGYPVIDVQCKERADNSVTLKISQSKFRANNAKAAVGKGLTRAVLERISGLLNRSHCFAVARIPLWKRFTEQSG